MFRSEKNDDAVYFALAEIAKEENKIGEALNFYQNAFGIDTSNVIYLQELAFMQAEKTNFEEAEVLFRKLCKKEPRNLDFIYGYSKVLIYNKQYEQAIKQLTKLQDQAGTVPELMMMKADLYMELKNHQKAEEALLQLKDEFPSNQEVLDKIVAFYKQQGEEGKAKKY
ncbi:hypothetical protein CW751_02340 [Brumimicrobium salinarum]|uniref:Uncharacterized protein n=1 Tax=Brumimicrobium salinarum TaxID=2058658 RepID=A0A2I0R716_9FLAO|nr:tetratricopeptide repeat protein [Brumimicrobium salinarum]PKR82190.1 hypothetical protein CW751_02340 [Brumimicrobium salinarum]